MKTTIKTLKKLMLVVLLTLISTTVFSASIYVCSGATINAQPPTSASTGLTYTWSVDGGTFTSVVPNGSGIYQLTAPSATTTPKAFTVVMRSATTDPALCPPADVTTDMIALPPLSFDLETAPTNASYCTSAAAGAQSVITPTLAGFPTGSPYTTDLEAFYSYSVLKPDGNTEIVSGTTPSLGSVNQTSGEFTLTATAIGDYVITGTVKYKNKSGFVNTLASTGGCPTVGVTTQTVHVIAAPAAPSITFTTN